MKKPEITGWELTTNEKGIKMATLPADQIRKALFYMEWSEKAIEEMYEALRLALPYVKGAYECAFSDEMENDYVQNTIESQLKQ